MIDSQAALLGGEIHDELIPLLFASSASVHRLIRDLDGETGEEHLDRLRGIAQWLDQAMTTGRRMIGGVFPPDFQAQAWHRFAETQLEHLVSRSSDTISSEAIHWSIDQKAIEVESEIAFAAMRITVEACRNAIRHGRATQINVSAEVTNGKLGLSIQDNGSGFDPGQIPEGHFGLRVMKELAAHAGGELSIESKLGSGTTIKFALT